MATISTTAEINSIRLIEQGSAPSTPASGYSSIFAKADGLYIVDDAGGVTGPFKAVTLGSDTLWDAKGDLVVGSGANTATKLTVGSNGKVLTANSGATEGVEWATPLTVATDAIWDTKGDLAVATGANTAAALTAGTNGDVLTVDSGEVTGLKWVAPATGATTLDGLSDVDTTGVSDGDVLAYDVGSGDWLPVAPATSGSVATDAIWDTKGDLAVATAADTAAKLPAATNGYILTTASGETTGLKWVAPVRYLTLGSIGTLTATAKTFRLYSPFTCTVTNVAASVGTAPTGASIVADVLKNGSTIWGSNPSNRPTITATNFSDLTNTPDTTAITAGDYLTLTIAAVGSTIAGADLNVTITVTVP